MSFIGTFYFDEQAAVASTYAAITNKISLAAEVRQVRVLAVGTGQMLFMIAKSKSESAAAGFNPATDLADKTKRFKMLAADPTKTSQGEYIFEFDHPVQDFYFLSASTTVAAYVSGETLPSEC